MMRRAWRSRSLTGCLSRMPEAVERLVGDARAVAVIRHPASLTSIGRLHAERPGE